jgi:hypothetical protein
MKTCDHCGNSYERCFDVVINGETHTFDSFECAIHALAPTCCQCGCRILGHGVQVGEDYYCCAHCSRKAGEEGAVDHVP